MTDNVNHPAHYTGLPGLEVIDIIRASLGAEGFKAYCCGNAIKYRMRAGKKGDAAECLAKADTYERWANEAQEAEGIADAEAVLEDMKAKTPSERTAQALREARDLRPWHTWTPFDGLPPAGPLEVRFKNGRTAKIKSARDLGAFCWMPKSNTPEAFIVTSYRPA